MTFETIQYKYYKKKQYNVLFLTWLFSHVMFSSHSMQQNVYFLFITVTVTWSCHVLDTCHGNIMLFFEVHMNII